MELLFNLAWLGLALTALAICWSMPARSERARIVRRSGGLLLAGCLSAVVFPAVSVSDDLGAVQAVVDERGSSKSVKKSTRAVSAYAGDVPSVAEQILENFVRPRWEIRGNGSYEQGAFPQRGLAATSSCRAPPNLSPPVSFGASLDGAITQSSTQGSNS